jgi:ATP-dependent DNA helicase
MKVEVTTASGIADVTEDDGDPLNTKERKHQKVQKARGLTKQIATARRKRKIALSPQERAAKAGELQNLLKQSVAFSAILTKKTQVLGRVGTALDGKSLGQHDLKMAEQPKILVGGTMRDYQLEGLTWMYEICAQGMSGILADEMGLGKSSRFRSTLLMG